MDFNIRLKRCNTIAQIFELVKEVTHKYLGMDQAGLMVGLADLGTQPHSFIGAFYSIEANTIVINNKILQNILTTDPNLYTPYLFYVLLHEYVHSLGFYDEAQTRQLVLEMSTKLRNKSVSDLSINIEKFFPNLILSKEIEPSEDINIDFIPGIDRKNTDYIM